MTTAIINHKPEVTLYYAAVPTDRVCDSGSTVNEEYLFHSEKEAIESQLEFRSATWTDINNLADGGHHYPEVIINTSQGRFEWVEVFEEDYDGEMELINGMYRHQGAPEVFSEAVEHHLFWNIGSELILIEYGKEGFTAQIKNANGEIVLIDSNYLFE
ncbi:hypothetical protein [Paenibacillus macquariensis]|uniref:Uncharacterized protein n=1 Tax=Paenibacillus macquariensis TaxID=948756 RepID=A0ABY1K1D2_9BACL|nr:hypothetical protein [Paenibacillus macquariensis]MEC0091794.1 hypothetical protein [Paenibacillus macquariensis]OAB32294.1 hypothetical protein PMSM_16935 [Paenibacillus macquariensis subsp. macquariensis]SIR11854.1 hypothetical protein SAMN05421578_107121 [Paenibacillus macquariensis]